MHDKTTYEDLIIRIFRQESIAGKRCLFTKDILEHPLNIKPRQKGFLSSLAHRAFPHYLTKLNIYTFLDDMVKSGSLEELEEPDGPDKVPRTVYSLGPGGGRRQKPHKDSPPKWDPRHGLARI